ncbi:MAG: hypothetical protein Q9182_000865 [Xanthomendoza sp. 2 TL-2023]
MPPTTSTTSTPLFFDLLVPELRQEIFSYLIPTSIHISPHFDTNHPPPDCHPWAPASVSRAFRAEARAAVYPHTEIKIHFEIVDETRKGTEAFDAWMGGLDDDVAKIVKHISVDEGLEVFWVASGLVVGQELCERAERVLGVPRGEGLGGVDIARFKGIPYWETRWLRSSLDERRVGFVDARLKARETWLQQHGEGKVGLGKAGIMGVVHGCLGSFIP